MARVLVTGHRGRVGRALTHYLRKRGHECRGFDLATGDDVCSATRSRRLARKIMRRVTWRGGEEYELQPYRTLVDNSAAKRVLRWQPVHGWRR